MRNQAMGIVVYDMVNNNNNVSTILIVGNQNPPIKTEEKIKGALQFLSRVSTTN